MPLNRLSPPSSLSKPARGAQAELLACAWLLEQGYEVFRNVSPSGDYDLAIREPDKLEAVFVDVCTGCWCVRADGTKFVHVNHNKHRKSGSVLVVVGLDEFLWLDDERVEKPSAKWKEKNVV